MSLKNRWPVLCPLGLLLMLALGGVSYGQAEDPVKKAISAYETTMSPVLLINDKIANTFVTLVLQAQGSPDVLKAVERIEKEVIPQSRIFLEKVESYKPKQPQVAEAHAFLVEAAKLRLEGYEDIVAGYRNRDYERFNAGKEKVTQSKIEEDKYIDAIETLAHAHGLGFSFFGPRPDEAL